MRKAWPGLFRLAAGLLLLLLLWTALAYDTASEGAAKAKDDEDTKPAISMPAFLAPKAPDLTRLLVWESLALAILASGRVLALVFKAGRQIVIEELTDHTVKSKDEKGCGKALAAHLGNELGRIVDLYRVVDEASASQSGEVSRPSISVLADTTDPFAGLVAPASLKLGFFEVPTDFLFALLRRIGRGPRLVGSLHQEGAETVILAELVSRASHHVWRVDPSDLEPRQRQTVENQPQATAHALIEVLACRIATDLMPLGSPRWHVIRSYNQGLRHYRAAQRKKRGRMPALRQAEQAFLAALEGDVRFSRCHYNLGVVYGEMGLDDAARASFRRALDARPSDFKACYGLAVQYLERGQLEDALWFAGHTLSIAPAHAGAWNLRSKALSQLQETPGPELRLPESEEVVAGFERAVLDAWRDLCLSQWRDRNLEEARDVARICATNVGIAYFRTSRSRHCEIALRQALRLRPHEADVQFTLAWAYFLDDHYRKAGRELSRAFEEGIDPEDRPVFWTCQLVLSTHFETITWGRAERKGLRARSVDFRLRAIEAMVPKDFAEAERSDALKLLEEQLEEIEKLRKPTRGIKGECLDSLEQAFEWIRELEGRLSSSEAPWKALASLSRPGVKELLGKGREEEATRDRKEKKKAEIVFLSTLRRILHLRVAWHCLAGPWRTVSGERVIEAHRLLRRVCAARSRERASPLVRMWIDRALAFATLRRVETGEVVSPKDLERAREAAERAVRMPPDGAWDRLVLCRILRAVGELERARAEILICLEDEPGESRVVETFGELHAVGLHEHPGDLAVQKRLGEGRSRLEDARGIVGCLSAAAKVQGTLHYWLGRIESDLDNVEPALAHLAIAAKAGFEPNNVERLSIRLELRRSAAGKPTDPAQIRARITSLLDRLRNPGTEVPREGLERDREHFRSWLEELEED